MQLEINFALPSRAYHSAKIHWAKRYITTYVIEPTETVCEKSTSLSSNEVVITEAVVSTSDLIGINDIYISMYKELIVVTTSKSSHINLLCT